jgi:hypothetical protein
MTNRSLKYLICVPLLCALGVIEYLNFTGFCYADGRYHTERELVDFAITRALNFSKSVTVRVPGDDKIYRSTDEFREINPDCCALHKWGHEGLEEGIWIRIFGWYIAVADVWFLNKSTGAERFFHAEVYISACGEIKRIGGYSLSRLPAVK